MRSIILNGLAALAVASTWICSPMAHAAPSAPAGSELEQTYQQMEKTFGFVPKFLSGFPTVALPGAWKDFQGLYLNPKTALPAREKSLISLAVDAQIPCRYCTYFDSRLGKLDQVTDQQSREAVAMAALTRKWSTMLNGIQMDEDAFRAEVRQIMNHARSQMGGKASAGQAAGEAAQPGAQPGQSEAPSSRAQAPQNAEEAYRDIRQTMGTVPRFLRLYPAEAIAGAWQEMKTLQLNPNTTLSGKEKELIGLAVAAQIPCRYCVTFHTEAARLNGASDRELTEALALASVTRHWSTILEGSQIDETSFHREVDRIVDHMKKATTTPSQLGGQAAGTPPSSGPQPNLLDEE